MKCVLAGYGEVGQGIHTAYYKHHEIDVIDPHFRTVQTDGEYEVLLVAFPYSDKFIKNVKEYIETYKTKATIIFSTVEIGTTAQIPGAVHVPVEGKHPDLKKSIENWQVFIGGENDVAKKFFMKAHINFVQLSRAEHTEALKLLSTSFYGTMIEFTRYAKTVCDKVGMQFKDYRQYNQSYNTLYRSTFRTLKYMRPDLDPPEGDIGGHCVVPNSKILDAQFPYIFLKEIYRSK